MKNAEGENQLKSMGWFQSIFIFASAGLALFLGTRYLIPAISIWLGVETVISWFIVAGLSIFLPLLIVAFILLKREGVLAKPGLLQKRLRFRRMNRDDWLWSAAGIVAIGVCSGLLMKGGEALFGATSNQPPFMAFEPLTAGRLWILAVWLPYWLLNIMGEEILWRGVILPRQEIRFGKWTWLVHGLGWSLFHIPFGWQLLITMLPILFIQSYIVQKRQNTWTGVFIHAAINGPSFIAISFGLL